MIVSDLIFDLIDKNLAVESSGDFGGFNLSRESYEIKDDYEVKMYGKPKGKYELLSISNVLDFSHNEINNVISALVQTFINIWGNVQSEDRVLIVGLGNRHISSDSLGAKVVSRINVTFENKVLPKVMAIVPSVMGLTGIETVDIIEGVSKMVTPTHIIVIDSLCAGAVDRLGKSIQVTNTGICPGAGIGNHRKCIDNSIAPKIMSIGVPLLIYASTFIIDTFNKYDLSDECISTAMHNLKKHTKNIEIFNILKKLDRIINDDLNSIIVSIKDIEQCVEILSKIISSALNIFLGIDE